MTVPQIARGVCTSRQNVRVVITRLVGKGLARLVANPEHRKSPLVQTSAEGEARLALAERKYDETLQGKLGGLEESEIRQAIQFLRRTRDLISGGDAGPVPPAAALQTGSVGARRLKARPGNDRRHSMGKSSDATVLEDSELPVSLL